MTTMVAEQSKDIVGLMGENAHIMPHLKQAAYVFFVNNDSVARIVEGCNGISVMILFVAFIVAFSSKAIASPSLSKVTSIFTGRTFKLGMCKPRSDNSISSAPAVSFAYPTMDQSS